MNERVSGLELLALYGEDEELLGKIRLPKIGKGLKRAAMFTPAGLMYKAGKYGVKKARKRLKGDDRTSGDEALYEELLGATKKKKKKFLPGLGKGIKKVGKVTSGFTTGIARAVGVPAPLLTALSKIDPTKGKKASAKKAVNALVVPPEKMAVSVPRGAMDLSVKKIAIVGGIGLGSLIVLKVLLTPKR